MRSKWFFVATLAASVALAQVPAEVKPALDQISANSLRGDVSFLAADLLQGRATPSPGLDIAAEFIAARLRAAGLEPAGDDGYFQTAHLRQIEQDMTGFKFLITNGKDSIDLPADSVALRTAAPLDFTGAEVVKPDAADRKGKVVIVTIAELRSRNLMPELRKSGAALVVVLGMRPKFPARLLAVDELPEPVPLLFTASDPASKLAGSGQPLKVTIHAAAPKEKPVIAHNVAALLHGSDPKLKDTYVLVTAHYDHVGVKTEGQGDRVYNGANDDASGTASMMEVAGALSSLTRKPRRSILFIAFFGEEAGLLGSKWYAHHPLVPLAKTVADINLEQLGRTDDRTGPQLNDATITGFDFSDVPKVFERAGALTGIKVYRDEKRSDPFFSRSDNQALADSGVPAHTMCVAFEFPDYHGVGDEWPKLDYENMAKVDRMVALGVWMLAQGDGTPAWNTANPQTKEYVAAAAKLHETAPSTK